MSDGNLAKEKKTHDLLAKTIAREKSQRTRDFLAPYTEQSNTAIVKMDGVNYKFRIVGFQGSGFGVFHPVDPTCARFVGPCDLVQINEYLQLLPQVYVILVCETDLGWCGYPHNVESAQKKLGLDCEIIIRNVTDVERFEVISTRYDGCNFWYEEPFAGADPVKAQNLRECFALRTESLRMERCRKRLKGITPEESRSFDIALSSWRTFQRQSTEGQIREFLARSNADLDSYVIRGQQIELTWQSKSGRYYKSRVDKDTFDVVSAGICLNNEDRKFHLKDLPGVIREGEEQGVIYVTEQVVDNPRHLDIEDE